MADGPSVKPRSLRVYEDLGVGLVMFGGVLGALVAPLTVLTGIEIAVGLRSPPGTFWPMLFATIVAGVLIVVGAVLVWKDQRDRQRRLQEFDSPPW